MGATEVSDKEAREDCTEWHILLPENESLVFLEASMGLIHHVYRWIRSSYLRIFDTIADAPKHIRHLRVGHVSWLIVSQSQTLLVEDSRST